MFFKNKKLKVQLKNAGKQIARLKNENEILLIFRKEIEVILKENHYGSVDNFAKKISSAVKDSHRLLHY